MFKKKTRGCERNTARSRRKSKTTTRSVRSLSNSGTAGFHGSNLFDCENIDCMENQNGSMKRDIEIMRIKLKQYEQLQQLTAMLQESHKSLVTTNEHLLQEINLHKQQLKNAQPPPAAAAAAAAALFNGFRPQPASNGHLDFSSNGHTAKGDLNGGDSSGYITSSMNYPPSKSASINSSASMNRKQIEQQLLANNLVNNRFSFVK